MYMPDSTSSINATAVKPILLTGAHRSGTTWSGRMLSLSPSVVYLHEPFSPHHDRGLFGARTDQWFTYVSRENEAKFLPALRDMLQLKYNILRGLVYARNVRGIPAAVRAFFAFRKYRFGRKVPLLKDPTAVFSSEWLASTAGLNVIVLIRHPAAMAASVKAKNWRHPFDHFLQQPYLMRDHLFSYRDEIAKFASSEQDIVDQAALLWTMIYATALKFQQAHPEWMYVRHEDLARDPLSQYQVLYQRLGLAFTERIREQIISFSRANQATNQPETSLTRIQRDSASTTRNWKSQLTADEINRIKDRVQVVSQHFYGEEDWQ